MQFVWVIKIKIIVITQGISPIVQPLLSSHHEILGMVEDAPRVIRRRNKGKIHEVLVGLISQIKGLRSLCNDRNIPYFYLKNKNQVAFESWVRSKEPDMIVVYSMSHLLKENIISIPKYGAINLHPSLLPAYRGPNPLFWMYYNMEKEGGITVHYIDKGEDTGDIIYQESYDIPLGVNGPELQNKVVTSIGVPLLLKAINAIELGNAPRIPQPEKSPTLRARNIPVEEQLNIIDWENWDVERIWHIMRGYAKNMDLIEPPKGIFAGQRWMVGGCTRCNTSGYSKGVILKNSNGYYVAAVNGIIQLFVDFQLKRTLNYLLSRI